MLLRLKRNLWRIAIVMGLIVNAAVLATVVIAQGGGPQGEANPESTQLADHQFTGGPITFKRVQTKILPVTTTSTAFSNVAVTSVPVGPGRTALINALFTAESRCNGGGDTNWCELRILIGGVEGHPQASSNPPSTFAFDSTDGATEGIGSWEGHAMERHRCLRNGGTTTVNIPVIVQWKVTNFDGGTAPEFWLDDWSLAVERSDNCSPVQ